MFVSFPSCDFPFFREQSESRKLSILDLAPGITTLESDPPERDPIAAIEAAKGKTRCGSSKQRSR